MRILITLVVIIALFYFVGKKHLKRNKKSHLLLFCLLVGMTVMVAFPLSSQIERKIVRMFVDGESSWRLPLLLSHILLATPCTLLGPLLIFKPYRHKFPNQHRFIGKLYVIGVLISAILVLPLSLTNGGGVYPRVGFSTMAILWFCFTLKAYLEIKKRNIVEHERWMLRSYAMTFAFVHVNVTYIYLGVYSWVGREPIKIKILQSVVSWSINLLLVEIFLRTSKRHQRAKSKTLDVQV